MGGVFSRGPLDRPGKGPWRGGASWVRQAHPKAFLGEGRLRERVRAVGSAAALYSEDGEFGPQTWQPTRTSSVAKGWPSRVRG